MPVENGEIEVISQVDSEISTEGRNEKFTDLSNRTSGPVPSQDLNKISSESQIQNVTHVPVQEPIREENGATAEVISNTADILEPEDPLPVLSASVRPPSAPTVVIHQPTKIE